MAEHLLEIKNLTVEYVTDDGVAHAVNDLSLILNEQETLGLVGETGAGKTTTALSILKLLPPKTGVVKSGNILLNGESIIDKKEEEMRDIRGNEISMIFQDPMTSLNPVFTVGSQVAEVIMLHNHGMGKNEIEKKVDDLFLMVGLPPKRKNEYPHQFSGGMKQRIVIAMALACEPKLLLADEPTTALDVTIQAQVLKMMSDLKEKFHTAMVLITHDLGIVAQTCDKVAVIYAGAIIENGTVEDIFEGKNHHPYTIGLFGSIPNMEVKMKRLNPIEGLTPDPYNLPTGCTFHPRCSKCMEICKTEVPSNAVFGTQTIRCHLFKDSSGR